MKEDDEVIVCLFPHLGDIVYGLSYAEQFKKETGKKICVYCGENMLSYLKNYPFIDRIITYNTKSLEPIYVAIFPFIRYMGKNKYNKDGIIATVPTKMHFKGLTALEVYRDYVYNVKEDSLSLYPVISPMIQSIENFESIKNKMIIINPYSFSMKTDIKLFEAIAKNLTEQGYIVYTNCMEKFGQKCIKGTKVFDVPILETYSIVNEIAMFISVRSGIVDMLSSGSGKLFIIYSSGQHVREYFSVKELNPTNTQEEYYKNAKDTTRILNSLNSFLNKTQK